MVRKKVLIVWVLLVSSLCLVPASVFAVSPDYTIDGDTVYIDDSNIYLAATPHTSSGGWVYLNFTSKRLEGSVDLIFGFDREKGLPERLELYNPHDVYTPQSYAIPDQYFTNKTFYKAEYTYASQDATWLYDGHVKLSDYFNGTWFVSWEHDFERAEKATRTVYWTDVKHITWVNLAGRVDITRVDHEYLEMDRWYLVRADVVRDRAYYLRLWLDVIPSQSGGIYEYFVGVKPSAETLKEAIASGHFYYLDPWWDNSWAYKSKLTVDQTKIDADLTDFPVLVYLNSSRINWAHVQDDLDDLRFVDSTETTVLKAELESYTLNDEAWIWVKVPAVSGTVDTDFYMYYGNAGAASVWDGENVWASDAVMVLHMTDATTSTILDSTSNNNDGAKKAVNEPIETSSGKIDSAQNFDGTNDYINGAIGGGIPANFTLCIWITWNDVTVGNYPWAISLGAPEAGIYLRKTTNLVRDKFDVNIASFLPNETHFMTTTYSAGTALHYMDGVYKVSSVNTITFSNTNWRLGDRVITVNPFGGILDEIRIYNGVKTAAWIKADYNSGADTLLTYGAEVEYAALTVYYNIGISTLYIDGIAQANGTTVDITLNANANATAIPNPNYIFFKHKLATTPPTLDNPYIWNMTTSNTLWTYAVSTAAIVDMNINLKLLVYISALLSLGFYLGERVMPWFIAIIMGALSGILFLAAGFYWTVSDATIPVYGWLWTLWGVINLILVTYFSIGLMRINQDAYPENRDLYGDTV